MQVSHALNATSLAQRTNTVISIINNLKNEQNVSKETSSKIKLSPTTVVGVTSFLCLVIFISVFGNIIALIIFRLCRELRNITSFFIINLCISDLMVAAFSLPFWISYIHTGWPSKEDGAVYKLWICLDIFCGCFSITNLTLISIERYTYIVYPLSYESIITKRRALFLMGVTPVYSIVACLLGYLRMSTDSPGLVIPILFAAYVIPVAIMGYAYGHIFQVTKLHCEFIAAQKKDRKRFISLEMTESPFNDRGWCYGRKNGDSIKSHGETREEQKMVCNEREEIAQHLDAPGCKLKRVFRIKEIRKEKTFNQLKREGIEDWKEYVDNLEKKRDENNEENKSMENATQYQSPDAITAAPKEDSDHLNTENSSSSNSSKRGKSKWRSLFKISTKFPFPFWRRMSSSEEGIFASKNRRQFRLKSWKSDLKAAKAVGLIIGTFVLLWTPFMAVVLLTYVNVQVSFGAVMLVKCLHYSNSAINPILYVAFNRIFRTALRKVPAKLRKY